MNLTVDAILNVQDVSSALSQALNAHIHGRKAIGKEAAYQWICAIIARWFTDSLSGGAFDKLSLGLFNPAMKREVVVYLARYAIGYSMHEGGVMTKSWEAVFADALGVQFSSGVLGVWSAVGMAVPSAAAATGPVSGGNVSFNPPHG